MGTRAEKVRATRDEMDRARGSRGMTRVTEGQAISGEKPRTPAISHAMGVVGLLLVLLDVPLVLFARSVDWRVSDVAILLIVGLFVGGIGLVGLGAAIRIDAARRR